MTLIYVSLFQPENPRASLRHLWHCVTSVRVNVLPSFFHHNLLSYLKVSNTLQHLIMTTQLVYYVVAVLTELRTHTHLSMLFCACCEYIGWNPPRNIPELVSLIVDTARGKRRWRGQTRQANARYSGEWEASMTQANSQPLSMRRDENETSPSCHTSLSPESLFPMWCTPSFHDLSPLPLQPARTC